MVVGPLGELVDRAARRRHHHLGPHRSGRRSPTAAARARRPAGAAALQHADRDLLHDRAAHPRARLLRLHRARPDDHRDADRDDPDVSIEAIGKQWAWDFNYVETRTSTRLASRRQLADEDPRDVVEDELPTLYLPVDKKVKIELQSRDVIHSFWVVDFLYKKDMYPGRDQLHVVRPRRARARTPASAPSCAVSTTRDALQRQGRLARPSTRTTSTRCATPARQGHRRRVRPLTEPARHRRARAARGRRS